MVNERHARQARSRKKMLERMDKVERPTLERRRMGLELNGWRGSNKVLELSGVHKAFGAVQPLHGVDLLLASTQRPPSSPLMSCIS